MLIFGSFFVVIVDLHEVSMSLVKPGNHAAIILPYTDTL